ncbi:cupin domain-containing protein [Cellulosimicrobium sp. CUA-896]|uniref:cupin domain-containing protein n=1 Tax=Cellulosimicrobium sp. CUA-896 TaxID=1517881 RepID=UPI000A604E45|nr:cupin domain-containing protein [Cellulosimicrobium sp. CUA-896]
MDVVAGLLDGPRARGAFLLRSHLRAPWAMRIEDEAPLTIVPVLRGSAWVGPAGDGEQGVPVGEGDVVLFRGPEHYVVADSPATAPQVVVGPASDMCRAVDGGPSPMTVLGVRSWGNDPDGETVIVTGTYPLDGEVGRRILRVLPQRVVLRRGDVDGTLVAMLAREVVQDLPGQEAVLDRLLDLLLIACLRTWLSRPAPRAGTAPTPTRWSVPPCAWCTTTRPARGPSTRSRARSACRAPPSRVASPSSSASRP